MSSSTSPPPNKHPRLEWDFLSPPTFPSSPTMSPSPERETDISFPDDDAGDNHPLFFRSTSRSPPKTPSIQSDNFSPELTPILDPNVRLTRRQAQSQGITIPDITSYYAYPLPLFTLFSVATQLDPYRVLRKPSAQKIQIVNTGSELCEKN